MNNENLTHWLEKNAVSMSHHEYAGINSFSIEQLGALKALVEAALKEKLNEIGNNENNSEDSN